MSIHTQDTPSLVSRHRLTDEDTCAACRNGIQRETRQEIITHPNCVNHGMTHTACLVNAARRPLIPHIDSIPCPACRASLNIRQFGLRSQAISALSEGITSPGLVIFLMANFRPISNGGKYWQPFQYLFSLYLCWAHMPRGEFFASLKGILAGLAFHFAMQRAGQNPSLKSSALVASLIGALCEAKRLF